jgi:trimeric autotransporter adhesin
MLKRDFSTLGRPSSHFSRNLPWVSSLFALAVLTTVCGCSNSDSGSVSTIAGNATIGYSGDGGPATSAELWAPSGVAVDASGNLYIADLGDNVVRKVTASTGTITTVAGDSIYMGADTFGGYSGDGGPAVSAKLNGPVSIALDASGNLYIADDGNNLIRKVTASTGIITTVAGYFVGGNGGYSGDGGPAVKAQLKNPHGVAVDVSGNLYIADTGNNVIRKVSASTGIISTAVGNGYRAGTNPGGYGGDNGPATSAELSDPVGVALDASGNLYIADAANMRVRKVDASTGTITTVAGNGVQGSAGDNGAATSAELNHLMGVTVDPMGNLYVADTGNMRVRKVDASNGKISAMAGSGVQGYSGDGGPANDAKLNNPWSVVVDSMGNLYIADYANSVVRKVTLLP